MISYGGVGQLREYFEAQFEPSGDGRCLYRRSQKGEPIPVSAEERDRFVRQYVRRVRMILGGMVVTLVVSAMLTAFWSASTNTELRELPLYIGISAIAAVAIALMYWVKGAPARELDGRGSVGRERSREEMRAIFFGRIRYGQLALAAGAGLIIVLTHAQKEDIFSGRQRLWLVVGACLILLAAVQAFRKWSFERDDQA